MVATPAPGTTNLGRREVEAVLAAARGLLGRQSFAETARSIFEACRNATGAEAGYVAVYTSDAAERLLVQQDAGAQPCRFHPSHPIPVRGLRADAYRMRRVVYTNDFAGATDAIPAGHLPIRNAMFVPMELEGRTVGMLGLANRDGGFDEEVGLLATAFADLAAIALSNSQALEALERSEERFRTTAESAADAIVLIDHQGQVVSWNRTAEAMTGYAAAEMVGRNVTDLMPARYRRAHEAGLGRSSCSDTYTGRVLEVACLRKDGGELPIELSLSRWATRDGVFFTGIIRDISARRRGEFERAFLIRASDVLAASLDSQTTLDKLASLAVPEVADWSFLELTDDRDGVRRVFGAHPDPATEARLEEFRRRHPLSAQARRLSAEVVRTGLPLLVPTVTEAYLETAVTSAEVRGLLRLLRIRSMLSLPLQVGADIVGVLSWFRSENPAPFEPRDLELAQEVGRRAATALQHAELHEATERERRRLQSVIEESRQLHRRISALRSELKHELAMGHIVGGSEAFRVALQQARAVAGGDTTVLLLGETGTGKELIARMIHHWSPRTAADLVPVNCASIPETLVESELFGYEKGAFTGAAERRAGKFEAANGGTLFLDEIGDLPLQSQAKLLRTLQDGYVQRVGATRMLKVEVRVVAATNQDLERLIRDGRFRSDLYYRLNVFPIRLPALRERVEDVRPLFEHFASFFARRLHRSIHAVDEAVFRRLEQYPWPGNVRELQNVAERAVILTVGATIEDRAVILPCGPPQPAVAGEGGSLADTQRHAILAALRESHGRVSGPGGAAERLGLKPTTLHAKMRKLGIARRPGI
jgi:formate hydrogenlyase transcriptional activator